MTRDSSDLYEVSTTHTEYEAKYNQEIVNSLGVEIKDSIKIKQNSPPLYMLHSLLLCTHPPPQSTVSLYKKKQKWRDLLRAHSFERSAQDRDRKSLSDPLCSVLHNRQRSPFDDRTVE